MRILCGVHDPKNLTDTERRESISIAAPVLDCEVLHLLEVRKIPRDQRRVMSNDDGTYTKIHSSDRDHRPHRGGIRRLPAAKRRRADCRGTYPVRASRDHAFRVNRVLRCEHHSRRDLRCASSSPGAQLPESPLRHCLRTVLLRLPDTAAPKWLRSGPESSSLPPPKPFSAQASDSPTLVVGHRHAHHRQRDRNTTSRIRRAGRLGVQDRPAEPHLPHGGVRRGAGEDAAVRQTLDGLGPLAARLSQATAPLGVRPESPWQCCQTAGPAASDAPMPRSASNSAPGARPCTTRSMRRAGCSNGPYRLGVVEHVLDFGRVTRGPGRNGSRADVYFMDRRGRAALGKAIGEDEIAQLGRKLNVYVVGDDGRGVTVGRRTKRRRR